MIQRILVVLIVILGMPLLLGGARHPARSSQQLLIVCAKNWTTAKGIVKRFDKSRSGSWEPVGEAIPVRLGRNGMGWGVGLHEPVTKKDPQKKEGDLKTPTGMFWLSTAFGTDPADEKKYKMPFIHIKPTTEAVDDPSSNYYSQIVDTALIEDRDWNSSEKMGKKSVYDLGVVINHNLPVQDPSAGSCIFMHAWEAPHRPTTGSVAMSAENLREVMKWLDIKKKPTIAIIPMTEFREYILKWSMYPMPLEEYLAPKP